MSKQAVDMSEIVDPLTSIRNAILERRFFPNERLVEENLAQQLSTSRTAIRLALAVLEQQGLVVRERNHGARVREISDEDAVEIMELRSVLESLAARHAALRVTPADITQLRAMIKTLETISGTGDTTRFSAVNVDFHAEIIRLSKHQNAAKLIRGLRSQIIVFQYRPILEPGRMQQVNKEHRKLVIAIASKDGDAAEAAMRQHLDNAVDALRAAIKSNRMAAQQARTDA
jgi:DNA-binding GntR family transcriptional regulator